LLVGRPAATQFFQTLSALTRLVSTLTCGESAASSAAKRGASCAPKTSAIVCALCAYQPRLALPA